MFGSIFVKKGDKIFKKAQKSKEKSLKSFS